MTVARRSEAVAVAVGAALLAAAVFRRTRLRFVAPIIAGAGGATAGYRRIYRWSSPAGWAAMALDATWGLPGTVAGLAMQALQVATGGTYREDLAERQNLHVYEDGPSLAADFALTWGNVVSNAAGRSGLDPGTEVGRRRRRFVRAHEGLHVWQQRWFGPLYPLLYGSWTVAAVPAATVLWLRRGGSWRRVVTTVAYYDNPFEYWAYRNDRYWPPSGVDLRVAWGPRDRGLTPV